MALTLAQLRTRFEVIYDVAGSTVLATSEKNQLANDGYRALWAEVTSVNKAFRVNTDVFTIASGQTRALPADFQETFAVRLNPGTDQMVYLQRFPPKQASQQYMRTYRLQGSNLVIEPLQRAPGNYDHQYIPQPPVLAADGDQLDVELDQWQMYIVHHMVIEALAREETDISQFASLLVGLRGQVKQWAQGQRSVDGNQIENERYYRPWMWPAP